MKKIYSLLLCSCILTACASWDSEIVKQENGKNKFIRIEHPGCESWRKQYENLMVENLELTSMLNKTALNCLIKGVADDSHLPIVARIKKYSELDKNLIQSPNLNLKKLGHCYSKPILGQMSIATQNLAAASVNAAYYCSRELQQVFENSKSYDEYQDKLEKAAKELYSSTID